MTVVTTGGLLGLHCVFLYVKCIKFYVESAIIKKLNNFSIFASKYVVILPMSNLKDFIITINGQKVTTQLRAIIFWIKHINVLYRTRTHGT